VCAPPRRGLALLLAQDGAHAFVDHQAADGRKQQHVGKADGEIELAERAQRGEQPDTDRRAEDAACQQHETERQIDGAPAPIRDDARAGRSRDVARDARHRDRGRNADEDQERRHQKAAADAEHSRDESDRQSHA
jgi:hypothetical protein